MFSNYLFYVILHLIFYTAYTYSYKVLALKMKSAEGLTILINLVSALLNILLIPFFKIKFPTHFLVYLLLILSCAFYSINNLFQTKVVKELQMSSWSMLKQVSNVILVFAGVLFLKEKFVLKKFIGALIIIGSNILIFFQKDSSSNKKYIWLGFLASLFSALAMLVDARISGEFNIPFYSIFTFMIPSLMIVICTKITFKDIVYEFKISNKWMLILSCFFSVFAYLLKLYAYKIGEIMIVAPLCTLTVILNVIIGYLFLHERDNLFKKLLSSILIIIGIILIKL